MIIFNILAPPPPPPPHIKKGSLGKIKIGLYVTLKICIKILLSYDISSRSVITPCKRGLSIFKIDKPLAVKRFLVTCNM